MNLRAKKNLMNDDRHDSQMITSLVKPKEAAAKMSFSVTVSTYGDGDADREGSRGDGGGLGYEKNRTTKPMETDST